MSTFFEHVVEQYPPELRQQKYQYWRMLRAANEDFRVQHVPRVVNGYTDFLAEKRAFEQWMLAQWGLEVVVDQDGYSPYYRVVDQQKYLLFELKYAGSP
jgi:hypothetical protein